MSRNGFGFRRESLVRNMEGFYCEVCVRVPL